MGRAEQYRRNTEEAERLAQQSVTPLEREAFEKIAREWRAMAEEAARAHRKR